MSEGGGLRAQSQWSLEMVEKDLKRWLFLLSNISANSSLSFAVATSYLPLH
jgi:hypothetical protein